MNWARVADDVVFWIGILGLAWISARFWGGKI